MSNTGADEKSSVSPNDQEQEGEKNIQGGEKNLSQEKEVSDCRKERYGDWIFPTL